jgi:hypothetical protein
MHETHDHFGNLLNHQMVEGQTEDEVKQKLKGLYDQAMADPNVAEIRQTLIGRNSDCPCGSGKKFKKCCHPSQAQIQERKRKPGVPSREEMYRLLKKRSLELQGPKQKDDEDE